jgi:hypothetical protein
MLMLSVVMLNMFMMSVVMLNIFMLSVVMLNILMLGVVMLNIFILSVVAPFEDEAHPSPNNDHKKLVSQGFDSCGR